MQKMCGIYVLTHRESGRRYVGQSLDIRKRWRQHARADGRCAALARAIKKHGWEAFDAEMLCLCAPAHLNALEEYWISFFGCVAPAGFNLTTGGGQGKLSELTIEKLRDRQRNRSAVHVQNKLAAARRSSTRAKLSAAAKGRRVSPEAREKLRVALRGRVFSQTTLEAMSASAKQRCTPEWRDGMVALHIGRKHSAEHVRKALEARLLAWTDEKRAQRSAAFTGRTHDPATLERMRTERKSAEWRAMCATGGKRKQSPEQVAKRVAATLATKAAKKLGALSRATT